jgi:hypothetical protein
MSGTTWRAIVIAMLFRMPTAERRPYVTKLVGKWPHCSNIQCLAGRTLAEMQSACDAAELCSGFSFTQNASVGDGCLKDCGVREYGGYGKGDSDYWTLQSGVSDSESAGKSAIDLDGADAASGSEWHGDATTDGTALLRAGAMAENQEWIELQRSRSSAERKICERLGCQFEGKLAWADSLPLPQHSSQ